VDRSGVFVLVFFFCFEFVGFCVFFSFFGFGISGDLGEFGWGVLGGVCVLGFFWGSWFLFVFGVLHESFWAVFLPLLKCVLHHMWSCAECENRSYIRIPPSRTKTGITYTYSNSPLLSSSFHPVSIKRYRKYSVTNPFPPE
jgi:hypothetical protein